MICINTDQIKLFPCYSPKLMKFLTLNKGIRYKLVGLHPGTKKTFWVFVEDDYLNKAIKEWNQDTQLI